uniref:Bestrophin homolog n=1 Tax=Globodera rostochiensis TaxID=31243 RepID=A0A914HZ86_GLORO
MTVSYNQDIINTHSLTFLRVIFRWRGSLWKSVLYEVTLWLLCYYAVMLVYRTQFKKQQQIEFEHIAKYTDGKMDYIPLSFMHGFYVAFVVDRCQNVQLANISKVCNFGWKQIFANIGFVDSAAFVVGTFVGGTDAEARTHRRNFIRYLCLTQVLVLRDISIRVRRRFSSTESLVEAGYLQENERKMMESIQNGFPRYWVPIHWIFTLAHQLTLRGRLTPGQMEMILNESKAFREKLQMLINYDWVPVPLAYSQVVFLATRVYFLLCLFSRQFRIWEQRDSLICYMGWLKVAESLLNPLGEDDEDFESSYIIDRNLAVGMTMVDEFYAHLPIQKPDKFGKEGEIPPMYTEPSLNDPQHQLVGSAKLAADCDPNVLADPSGERRTPINQNRKRSSIFGRFLQRAVGDRMGAEGTERKQRNRSLFRARRRSATTAGPMSAEDQKNATSWKQRKSNSIACAPFTTSYDDHFNWPLKKGAVPRPAEQKVTEDAKWNGIDQLDFNKNLDGQILGKFLHSAPSMARFSLDMEHPNNEFRHLETLNEEDSESKGPSSRSNSRRSASSFGIKEEDPGGG